MLVLQRWVASFFNDHLKPITQKSWSHIKYSHGFLQQNQKISSIPKNAILRRANVEEPYLGIIHKVGSRALREASDREKEISIPTEDLFSLC